jgi:hypothetical protein
MIEWMWICWIFFLFKCTLNSQEPFWLSYIVKHFPGIWCIMMLGFEALQCWDLRHYDVGIWGIMMLGFEALRCWDLRHYDVGIWGITMLGFEALRCWDLRHYDVGIFFCSIFSFLCNVLYFIVCPFSFGHCIVWPLSNYGFWIPLWYLQTFQILSWTKINIHHTFLVNGRECKWSWTKILSTIKLTVWIVDSIAFCS